MIPKRILEIESFESSLERLIKDFQFMQWLFIEILQIFDQSVNKRMRRKIINLWATERGPPQDHRHDPLRSDRRHERCEGPSSRWPWGQGPAKGPARPVGRGSNFWEVGARSSGNAFMRVVCHFKGVGPREIEEVSAGTKIVCRKTSGG